MWSRLCATESAVMASEIEVVSRFNVPSPTLNCPRRQSLESDVVVEVPMRIRGETTSLFGSLSRENDPIRCGALHRGGDARVLVSSPCPSRSNQ